MLRSTLWLLLVFSINQVCSALYIANNGKYRNPVVNSNKGKVKGLLLVSQNGTSVYSYHGVPYSKPPVGDRRWAYPEEAEPWAGTLDATEFKPRCPQADMLNAKGQVYATDEDCLYLNVYTPVEPSSSGRRLPVLLMVHGGGYVSGGADLYPAQGIVNNLASRGIVVVTINYRLGALGFLTSGDERLPGNFGLMDMIMALQWTQDEIGNFGGDAGRVSMYGVSTGAHAVSILLMYPKVTEMVGQAVLQSGSSLLPTSTNVTAAVHTSLAFTQAIDCDDWLQAGPDQVLACARNVSADQVVSASFDERQLWRPAAAAQFLNTQLLRRPKMNMMIGVNRHEHSLFVAPDRIRRDWLAEVKQTMAARATGRATSQYYSQVHERQPRFYSLFNETDLQRSINRTLALYGIAPDSLATRIARILYDVDDREDKADPLYWFKQYVKLESDSVFFAPAYREASAMAAHGSQVFLFSFDYVSANDRCRQGWRGVRHADDQQYLMAQPGAPATSNNFLGTNLDYRVADCFGEMLANFVKFGDPSSAECSITWPPLQLDSETGRVSANYLSYGALPTVKQQFHARASQFWADTAWMLADMKY